MVSSVLDEYRSERASGSFALSTAAISVKPHPNVSRGLDKTLVTQDRQVMLTK